MSVHHTINCHKNSHIDKVQKNDEDHAYLRYHRKDSREDAEAERDNENNPEDGPFLSVGNLVAHLHSLDGRETLVQEEVDGKAPGQSHNDTGNEHEDGSCGNAHAQQADKQEELAEIDLEVLFVEDGKRVDNLALADLDNGFVETDGRAHVEVGDPNGYYIQDHHQNEGSYVLQTILDSIHDGLFDLELLSCHNVLDLVNLQAIR